MSPTLAALPADDSLPEVTSWIFKIPNNRLALIIYDIILLFYYLNKN